MRVQVVQILNTVFRNISYNYDFILSNRILSSEPVKGVIVNTINDTSIWKKTLTDDDLIRISCNKE
jgi:hypothetical protein